MNTRLRSVLAVAGMAVATHAIAQITLYEHEGYEGRPFTTAKRIADFERNGVNVWVSSVVVLRDRWEVCEYARFSGRCVILLPGRYPSLAAIGMDDYVSSVRVVRGNARIDDNRFKSGAIAANDDTVYGGRQKNYRHFLTIEP